MSIKIKIINSIDIDIDDFLEFIARNKYQF